MSETQPVIREFDMSETDDPEVDFSQGGVWEALQVYGFGAAEAIAGGFADGAGELDAAYAADAFRFQGDGACNLRIGPEFSTVPRGRVGGDDQCVVLLIPGIEA